NVGIRISILQGSNDGTASYVETHAAVTNANGLVSLAIGTGTIVSGTFAAINWGSGPYFIKTETDPIGGTAYTITGTTELLSVPYALYAKASGNPPAASGIAEYAYIYNLNAQVVALEADVAFSDNGVIKGGITHAPGTTNITLTTAGDYSIWFHVSGVEPNQFTLFQNGAPVAGATYGSGAGTQQNTGMTIITASAGDVLTVRNHTGAAAVTLQTLAGGTQINANASIKILYLGN
ncbi:BclA C-terminal domain-containing protein, partial [Dyadobacter bucti]|uniref:BclA C-terminal domain-containing protein n=1 Tax=Dyadobacter bucti TaxID=2572203 RepID=UPI0035B6228A